jgi:hypothetical protein
MSISVRLKVSGAAAVVSLAGLAIGTHGWSAAFGQASARQSQGPAAPSAVTAAGITLHSVSVELPFGDRMFPGDAAAEAINNNCLACHSAGMILNQPRLTRSVWQQEVEKMRSQYKAPVDEHDVPAIVAYLASHKGAE